MAQKSSHNTIQLEPLVVTIDPKLSEATRNFLEAYRAHKKRSAQVRIKFD